MFNLALFLALNLPEIFGEFDVAEEIGLDDSDVNAKCGTVCHIDCGSVSTMMLAITEVSILIVV